MSLGAICRGWKFPCHPSHVNRAESGMNTDIFNPWIWLKTEGRPLSQNLNGFNDRCQLCGDFFVTKGTRKEAIWFATIIVITIMTMLCQMLSWHVNETIIMLHQEFGRYYSKNPWLWRPINNIPWGAIAMRFHEAEHWAKSHSSLNDCKMTGFSMPESKFSMLIWFDPMSLVREISGINMENSDRSVCHDHHTKLH